jgi:hypothetical protein
VFDFPEQINLRIMKQHKIMKKRENICIVVTCAYADIGVIENV